jgi:hypothetical protein
MPSARCRIGRPDDLLAGAFTRRGSVECFVVWGNSVSMVELVRTAIGSDARLPTRRTFDERLMVRWPGAWAALSRALTRLPPRSRLRRALLRRNALSGWGAWVRGDLDLCIVRLSPDRHYDAPPEWLIAGMPTVYRGHAG